jgi:hypothetical protein
LVAGLTLRVNKYNGSTRSISAAALVRSAATHQTTSAAGPDCGRIAFLTHWQRSYWARKVFCYQARYHDHQFNVIAKQK